MFDIHFKVGVMFLVIHFVHHKTTPKIFSKKINLLLTQILK